MKKTTSLYLDLARFVAALAVLLTHLGAQRISGGFLWQAGRYSQTAVVIFFVLSGFVIAHVLATRERTPLEFAASRLARLYSVIIPALLLTAICNAAVVLKNPDFYSAARADLSGSPVARYVATLVLANRWWQASLQPPANTPFWSLSFEAAYYVAICLIIFSQGLVRAVALGTWAILVGPTIVILAPLWFLGYGAYRLTARRSFPAHTSIALWGLSGILLLFCWKLEPLGFGITVPHVWRDTLVSDYAAAVCFAVNIVAFDSFSGLLTRALAPFESLLRWLGSLTFALYLLHFPLLDFFTVFSIGIPSSWPQRLWVTVATLLVVILAAPLCDQTKPAYRRAFMLAVSAVQLRRRRWALLINRDRA